MDDVIHVSAAFLLRFCRISAAVLPLFCRPARTG